MTGCPHGHARRRKCEVCDREDDIARIADLEDALRDLQDDLKAVGLDYDCGCRGDYVCTGCRCVAAVVRIEVVLRDAQT